jgi:hypothetical protein
VAAAGARNGTLLTRDEPPLGVLERAVDVLATAVEQLRSPADLGVTFVALAEGLDLLATDPGAGAVELDVISDGLTHIAALLEREGVPGRWWSTSLVAARHAVSQLAGRPHLQPVAVPGSR